MQVKGPEGRGGFRLGTSVSLTAQVLWNHLGLVKCRPLWSSLEMLVQARGSGCLEILSEASNLHGFSAGFLQAFPLLAGFDLEQFSVFSWLEVCWNRYSLGTAGKVKELRRKSLSWVYI